MPTTNPLPPKDNPGLPTVDTCPPGPPPHIPTHPGAFAIPALGREEFVTALRRKLILEIAGTPLGSATVTSGQ